jgi:acyl-CoA synthetase (AMP-forming)/AMP-acid ligase II
MILVSGFNVYPNEIEEVIASHAPRRRAQECAADVGVKQILPDAPRNSVPARTQADLDVLIAAG